ncbi:MAG: hypothetical protein QXK89_02080 [Candidatus Bathyarchaeia archaeon]
MATLWNMPANQILMEFVSSEDDIKRDLLTLTLNRAIKEHGKILKEAIRRRIPPQKLLDWILASIKSGGL